MKSRKWAHVAVYDVTPLQDGRVFMRRIQVDLFRPGALMHKMIRDRNKNWSLAEGYGKAGSNMRSELVTTHKPAMGIIRREIIFWDNPKR